MPQRWYFPTTTAADVSPALDSWVSTTGFLRRKLSDTKGSSAITTGSTISSPSGTANTYCLDRQYVSPPLAAQTIAGTVTFKGQLMGREFATSDNVDAIVTSIRSVSNNGSTFGDSLFNLNDYSTIAELINNATCRNVVLSPAGTYNIATYGSGSGAGGAVVLNDGDRLVVEIGGNNFLSAGTTPQFAFKWGENATDLPENDTQTTDGAGWIEFSVNIALQVSALTVAGSFSFTQSGTATGSGTLVGTEGPAFSQTGTAKGTGTLAGSASTSTPIGAADLKGTASCVGAPTATFSQTGTVLGSGSLVTAGTFAFTQAGTATGSGTLGGQADAQLAGTATGGVALAFLVASGALAITPSGVLHGSFPANGTSSVSVTMAVTGALAIYLYPVIELSSTVHSKTRRSSSVGTKLTLASTVHNAVRLRSTVHKVTDEP